MVETTEALQHDSAIVPYFVNIRLQAGSGSTTLCTPAVAHVVFSGYNRLENFAFGCCEKLEELYERGLIHAFFRQTPGVPGGDPLCA